MNALEIFGLSSAFSIMARSFETEGGTDIFIYRLNRRKEGSADFIKINMGMYIWICGT